jgi:hypothetical protein
MGKMAVTCVLALVFGFLGAAGAVAAFNDQLRGAQGPTGLTGVPGTVGPAGHDGADGTNGVDGKIGKIGKRGARGRPGKAASQAPLPATDLGTGNCAGRSVEVMSGARLSGAGQPVKKSQKLSVDTRRICLVKPARR